jgi:uncharacterized membrane protein (DUF485 family)
MSTPPGRVDWNAVEQSPEFQELIAERRRFVLPATIFFLAWYIGFVLLAGYAPDFMGDSVYEGLTVGYCLALTQFVMVFTLGYLYLRRADTVYDPLAAKVIEQAVGDPYADRPAAPAASNAPTAATAAPAGRADRGAAR